MRGLRHLVVGILLSGLLACSTVPGPGDRSVDIGAGLVVELPRASHAIKPFSAAQSAVIRFGDRPLLLDLRLRGDGRELHLVAVDGLGRRALTLTWRASGIDAVRATWLPADLPLLNFLADVFLIYWPDDSLRQVLGETDGTLSMDDRHRTISRNGQDIVRIDYPDGRKTPWSGSVRYSNPARGYAIDITSRESPP